MLKTVDLFAGAGGLSYGFESTGEFIIVAAAENNENARKTYIENHRQNTDIKMISDVKGYDFKELTAKFGEIDVVIGGPPCQGFSNANRQKNHIISMNNSLVKEYFRAVMEIKPKAFVIENVSMLSSNTHKFYDSNKDHDLVKTLGVQMRQDELIISDSDFDNIDLMKIFRQNKENEYKISDELFQLLNVLFKNRNSKERFDKYVDKHAQVIQKQIKEQQDQLGYHFKLLDNIAETIKSDDLKHHLHELGMFIKFQKSFRLKEELDSNEIIYVLKRYPTTGKITACVNSYSVIDYVNKILGDDYKKNSGVINSLWFGVPQERKRFIMIGVRSDIMQQDTIEMPSENKDTIVSVGEAIGDLEAYSVDEDNINPDIVRYVEKSQNNISKYAKMMRSGSEGVKNHIVPKSREKAKKRFAALKEGENFHKLSPDLKDNYTDTARTQNSIYLRLNSSRPSGTVINVRKSMWIHPSLNRAISVREAARLQSFPDKYVFVGTKDAQYQQVGNAVPPLMAKGIAEIVLKYL